MAASKPKHAGGRPTLYKLAYCEEVIKLGKLGYSPAQMAAHWDIARTTIELWQVEHPEFLTAYSRARVHAQAWWENKGQSGLEATVFNAHVWKTSMQARFREDYTERREISGPEGGPIVTEDATGSRELAKAMALILARGLKEADKE